MLIGTGSNNIEEYKFYLCVLPPSLFLLSVPSIGTGNSWIMFFHSFLYAYTNVFIYTHMHTHTYTHTDYIFN